MYVYLYSFGEQKYQEHNTHLSIIYDKIYKRECTVKCYICVYNAAASYTQTTYKHTMAFLSVTICINCVIPSAKQLKLLRGPKIGLNKNIYT